MYIQTNESNLKYHNLHIHDFIHFSIDKYKCNPSISNIHHKRIIFSPLSYPFTCRPITYTVLLCIYQPPIYLSFIYVFTYLLILLFPTEYNSTLYLYHLLHFICLSAYPIHHSPIYVAVLKYLPYLLYPYCFTFYHLFLYFTFLTSHPPSFYI